MAWASRAPSVMDALVDAITSAVDSSVTGVHPGPVVAATKRAEQIVVGYVDEDQTVSAAEGSLQFGGQQVAPQRETFTINCSVAVLSGSNSPAYVAAGRDRCFALLGLVGDVLDANPTIGGVMSARVGVWSLRVQQTQRGIRTQLVFGVDCDAFTAK